MGTSRTSCHLQIYQCELVHDGNPRNSDVGSSLSTAAWVLENMGVAPESEYPYNTGVFGQAIPSNVLAAAKTDELLKATKLDGPAQQDTINNTKASIASDYPAMFGMNWYNSFFSPDGSGNLPEPSGGIAGGHALALFSFDDNHVNGSGRPNGAFRGRNSWNAGWGLGGDFFIGYDLILNIDDGFSDVWNHMVETGFQLFGANVTKQRVYA
jgi:C1A family cysteine protease